MLQTNVLQLRCVTTAVWPTFCSARGLPPILAAYSAANCPSVKAQPSPADAKATLPSSGLK